MDAARGTQEMPGISMISMPKKKTKNQWTNYWCSVSTYKIHLWHSIFSVPSGETPADQHSPAAVPLNDWSFGSSCCPPNPRLWRRLWRPPRVRAPRAERPGRAFRLDSVLEGFMDFTGKSLVIICCVFLQWSNTMEYNGIFYTSVITSQHISKW